MLEEAAHGELGELMKKGFGLEGIPPSNALPPPLNDRSQRLRPHSKTIASRLS